MPDARIVGRGGRIAGLMLALSACSCDRPGDWRLVDMAGRLPNLAFEMTDARTGLAVTEDAFRGKVVLLEFGYTSCPDVCPTTLANLSKVLREIGHPASDVAVLFVTVDPGRDTIDELRRYGENFAPQTIGLRGTPNQLAQLARRYRVAYSVTPAARPQDVEVMHTPTVFIFDRRSRLRLLSPSTDDPEAVEHDLRILLEET